MIKANLWRDDILNVIGVEVVGHACTDEFGKDIVCAAASILTYTLIENLLAIRQAEELPAMNLESGNTHIHIAFNSKDKFEEAAKALDTIGRGYRLLEQQYPNAVSVNFG